MKNEEKIAIVSEFISKYKDNFPIINGDKNYYIERIINCIKYDDNNELVDEILYATNLLEKKNNPYISFANFIENKFGTNLNVLEVCCGMYPALSIELSKKQNSITAYDPLLIIDKHERINLKKEEFNNKTNIKNYDLVVAIKPCGASYLVIDMSANNNKDFMIYPCDCSWHMNYDEFDCNTVSEWHEYIYRLCLCKFKNVEISFLDNMENYKNPIYSYKKILK